MRIVHQLFGRSCRLVERHVTLDQTCRPRATGFFCVLKSRNNPVTNHERTLPLTIGIHKGRPIVA